MLFLVFEQNAQPHTAKLSKCVAQNKSLVSLLSCIL